MKNIKKIIFSFMASTLLLAGCSNQDKNSNESNDKIKIVTSVNFYSEVAKDIIKDKGDVISIVDNISIDPHDFEPSAEDAKKIANANIVILNGGGYDSWFEKLILNNKNLVSINSAKLIKLKDGENEHIWYNTQVLKNVAEKLTEELKIKDSSNSAFYEKNKNEYIEKINKISDKIKSLKSKSQNKIALATEPVFEYVIKELELKTTEEIAELAKATKEGNDPSPKVLKQVQEDIRNKKINIIINNVQTTNKTIESVIHIAEENNIPILNVTETKPNDKTYTEWMLEQYDRLEKILDGTPSEKAYHTSDAKESHNHNDHNHGDHKH